MEILRPILLVDDDDKDSELILTSLEENKLANRTEVVHDGVEALDYLYCRGNFADRTEGNPVVILLDLKMPRMDGIQVLRTIKADKQKEHIPIVILTSSREERDLEKCYSLGVNAYVVKPVRFQEFVEAVRNIGVFWALLNEPPLEE